mgnify:CR=1 FL=1
MSSLSVEECAEIAHAVARTIINQTSRPIERICVLAILVDSIKSLDMKVFLEFYKQQKK